MPRTCAERWRPLSRAPARVVLAVGLAMLGGCTVLLGAAAGDDKLEPDPTERTFGTYVDDEMLERVARVNLRRAAPGLEDAHLEVTSFNGIVLLTGQVASEELKRIAGETVSELKHVRRLHNELTVAPPTSFLARRNDGWLGAKVKSKLLGSQRTPGRDIMIVVEDGVVYLLGLVTREAGAAAAEITRHTAGVQKVVKMFEYID